MKSFPPVFAVLTLLAAMAPMTTNAEDVPVPGIAPTAPNTSTLYWDAAQPDLNYVLTVRNREGREFAVTLEPVGNGDLTIVVRPKGAAGESANLLGDDQPFRYVAATEGQPPPAGRGSGPRLISSPTAGFGLAVTVVASITRKGADGRYTFQRLHLAVEPLRLD